MEKKTRYYIDQSGAYIGGFEGSDPPTGSVEVPEAPEHAADTWTGTKWIVNAVGRLAMEGPTTEKRLATLEKELTQLRRLVNARAV